MTDKKTFGSFIKAKRTEKNYSQKDLAELLFVTEGAVSKWERGISYPDITLLADICRALDISEHELITASTDTDAQKTKLEARKFRVIRSAWIRVPTISYAVAIPTCFVCNLAVNHTLSWFFIVLAALVCAYTFVPTVTWLFESDKLLVFAGSTYLSICLLMFTCAVYTDGMSWFLTACIGVLMGYGLLLVPKLLSNTGYKRYRFVITFGFLLALTLLMMLHIRIWQTYPLGRAIVMSVYGFAPVILSAYICTLCLDGFLKAGICTAICGVMYYGTNFVITVLFGPSDNHYQVDFHNWAECANGNTHLICLLAFLVISIVFAGIGICRIRKRNKLE